MATHAATRNLSGLARAFAQHGLMPEAEADSLQTQAQSAGVTFVEQLLTSKRFSAQQIAVFGSFTNVLRRQNVLTSARPPRTGERGVIEMRPPGLLVAGVDFRV